MEGSKVGKRIMPDDTDTKFLEPILVRIDKHSCAPRDIRIDKDEVLIYMHTSFTALPAVSCKHLFLQITYHKIITCLTVQNRSGKGQR